MKEGRCAARGAPAEPGGRRVRRGDGGALPGLRAPGAHAGAAPPALGAQAPPAGRRAPLRKTDHLPGLSGLPDRARGPRRAERPAPGPEKANQERNTLRRNPMQCIADKTFDQERALYGSRGLQVKRCAFDGPADGESAFKECRDIEVERSFFNLRYPFWHDHGLTIRDSRDDRARAARPSGTPTTYRDREHQAPRHQGPAGVRPTCTMTGLRHRLPGVRLVRPAACDDGGLHGRERVLHDALDATCTLSNVQHEGQVLLPVHRERRL